jgi:predicted RNA-binding protein with RPS1 domain
VTASFASFDDDEEDFIPPPVVAPAETAQTKGDKDAGKDAVVAALEKQVGNTIDVMITSVESSKIVVSERLLAQSRGASALAVGASASGVVVSLSDFGAFVELSEDDPQAPRLEGLIHISELSWNRISHPRDVVRVGDEVDVKVLDVAPASGSRPARVTFSLKQLQADPLLETLDTIMPVAMPEPSVDEDELTDTPLPGLTDICSNLLTEEGIDAVIPGRQAVEQRVVSQDLELWLTTVVVEDGYNLLARAGRQVQEIHVVTGLDRDAIKRAIKRATNGLK